MSGTVFDGWERGSVQTLRGDEVPTTAVIFLPDDGEIEIDNTPNAGVIADAIMAMPAMLSALKAMDEALTKTFPYGLALGDEKVLGEAWLQIRSAITTADAR